MRVNYRVTPITAFAFSVVILGISSFFLVGLARDTVAHVTADAQPATIVDTEHHHRSTRRESSATSLTFELRDGSIHSDLVHPGFFWWPSVGETIHAYEAAPSDWKVMEDFSWPATIGGMLVLLIPWLFAILKLWDRVEQTYFPERWADSQRRERERRRAGRKGSGASSRKLSRRQQAKAQQAKLQRSPSREDGPTSDG